jgi:DNA-directed RNA polymerase specialized sigma24 family protein
MRSQWESLHAAFALSIRSRSSLVVFEGMKAKAFDAAVVRFGSPALLVADLNDTRSETSLTDKDRILGELVRASRRPTTSKLAVEMLLLGLWPGLSNLLGRLLRLYRDRPNELVADILAGFTTCAKRLDVARCTRVAATLILNTERVVRSARLIELRRDASRCALDDGRHAGLADPTADRATGLVELRRLLARVVPRDVELVIAIVVDGRDCHDAAKVFGLSHAATRQRLARALAKLRGALADSVVTDPAVEPAFAR